MSLGFKMDITDLEKKLNSYSRKADAAIKMFADTTSQTLASDCREQAKWTDRTGLARKSIRGDVKDLPNGYRIEVAYGVDYGLWLELANEQKYAIIEPTIRLTSPYIINDLEGLLNKMGV